MSDQEKLGSDTETNNGDFSDSSEINRQNKRASSPGIDSIFNIKKKPQEVLQSLCSRVEPTIPPLKISSVESNRNVYNAKDSKTIHSVFGIEENSYTTMVDVETGTISKVDKSLDVSSKNINLSEFDVFESNCSLASKCFSSTNLISKRKSISERETFEESSTQKNLQPNYPNATDVRQMEYNIPSNLCPSQPYKINSLVCSHFIKNQPIQPSYTADGDIMVERKIPPCRQALSHAVHNLYRIDDFHNHKIGAGFFSEVFKVTHKISRHEMVLKLNKHRSNRTNMLKEIQLMKNLDHPNILRLEGACVHEGQLHALTEYAEGGNLEQVIGQKDIDLPWSLRMSLALDVAKGLAYLHSKGWFHRDLTSKNILIRISNFGGSDKNNITGQKIICCAVIGDFGLATKIPTRSIGKEFKRLQQVGSPYWMSPECLKGEFYNETADLFSYGIIMCELIARMGADPDVLPRTSNFGVDYIAFSAICLDCPADFIQLAFNCVRIDPTSRPSAHELITQLETLYDTQKQQEKRKLLFPNKPITSQVVSTVTLEKVGHRRSVSEVSCDVEKRNSKLLSSSIDCNCEKLQNLTDNANHEEHVCCNSDIENEPKIHQQYTTPSEKARFHFKTIGKSVTSVGREMSENDPFYKPKQNLAHQNPFLELPLFLKGKKLLSEGDDKVHDYKNVEEFLFSSCFELTPNLSQIQNEKFTFTEIPSSETASHNPSIDNNNVHKFLRQPPNRNKRLSLPCTAASDINVSYPHGKQKASLQDSDSASAPDYQNTTRTISSGPQSCTPVTPDTDTVLDLNRKVSAATNFTKERGEEKVSTQKSITIANINRYFEDQMFQGRVQLLRRLYGGGCWITQDDSAIELSSFSSGSSETSSVFNLPPETVSYLKRRGSCESGFFSSGFDRNCSSLSSRFARINGSIASEGCTVDDLCSVGMMSSSARSVGSSLLTVSDLEEDLRAASIFLSSKRTSSIFTDDSVDDLSSMADFDNWEQRLARSTSTPHGSEANLMEDPAFTPKFSTTTIGTAALIDSSENRCYERDIRDIVNYFNTITLNPEANGCSRLAHATSRNSRQRELDMLFGRKVSNSVNSNQFSNNIPKNSKPELTQNNTMRPLYSQNNILPRSHKIESLIKRVAEKESRQRYRKTFGGPTPLSSSMLQNHQQRLQVCDGIVRSKLQIFDHTKRPQRSRLLDNQKPGHVKAKLALFDSNVSSYSKKGTTPQHINLAQPAVKSIDIRADKEPYDHHMISKKTKDKHLKTMGNNSSSSTETLNA